jgi:hypothetical protein
MTKKMKETLNAVCVRLSGGNPDLPVNDPDLTKRLQYRKINREHWSARDAVSVQTSATLTVISIEFVNGII